MDGRIVTILLASLLALDACADFTAPSVRTTDALRLSLSLAPDTLSPGQQFTAEVTLENLTSRELVLVSTHGCLAFVGVYRHSRRQSGFKGTDYACTANTPEWPIPPRAVLTHDWLITAGLPDEPVLSGSYRFRVDFNTYDDLPTLEHPFVLN